MSDPLVTRGLEYVPLSSISEDPENAKRHELQGIADSYSRWGLIDMPLLDERTGLLIGGHGRIQALRELKAVDEVPPEGIRVREDGEWLVPLVRGWASRDDQEARAAQIALNALVEKGGWDQGRLATILGRLDEEQGAGLAAIGYNTDDITALLKANRTYDPADRSGAARPEPTIDDLAQNYRNKQVRTLVFDYPLAEYREIQALAEAARKKHQVPGNPELLMALLRRWDQTNPAPA